MAVNLTDLSLPQLEGLKSQLDQEIEFLTSSIGQLKVVQTKYVEAKDSLNALNQNNQGKQLLVPLTSSMYVPGTLNDVEHVLVDVGTGYYVEKNVSDSKAFFKRKIDFLTKQIEKIQPALQEKHAMKQDFSFSKEKAHTRRRVRKELLHRWSTWQRIRPKQPQLLLQNPQLRFQMQRLLPHLHHRPGTHLLHPHPPGMLPTVADHRESLVKSGIKMVPLTPDMARSWILSSKENKNRTRQSDFPSLFHKSLFLALMVDLLFI
ncbi:uncharacterized protein LOC129186716 isoform X1 [Dunckerocampus dactyliophorus]|uniref:uncharacterized protein LOC129186716 isoform X1 n=1 Tax=Dunckerocampus dactyliophorus TaxID=161453 RepID=UPI0024063E84|nr:uncharacterized protein LOC129186716 isoform X1 [Dunckerocampus dactyliophorus]